MWVDLLMEVLRSTLRLATPMIFAAIGGLYSERSGVVSIGLEGIMLTGAFSGFMITLFTGNNLALGLLAAALSGVIINMMFAYLGVYLGVNQAIAGTAIVMFASGFTSYGLRAFFGVEDIFRIIEGFKPVNVPLLSQIPFLGRVFFSHDILVYFSWALILATFFLLYKTSWGLELRACGENPGAADTVGIKVKMVRVRSLVITGALTGIGGAYLSLAQSSTFVENMTAERGYSAFALIVLGKYHPLFAALGCLLYGFADAFQFQVQALGSPIPYQFLLMLPYVLTLIVLSRSKEIVRPEGLGKPFKPKSTGAADSLY